MATQEELDAEENGLFFVLAIGGCLMLVLAALCLPIAGGAWFFLL